MQFRRSNALLIPIILGLVGGVPILLDAISASADVRVWSPMQSRVEEMISKARRRLMTSDVGDPDTVWIGHVNSGGYGPYKIGRGPNLISGGTVGGGPLSKPTSSYDGVWDFDHFQASEDPDGGGPLGPDSLQGWWPIQAPFGSVGPSDKDDWQRPWFGHDYGNQGNYSPVQGRTFGVLGYWHADAGNAAMTTEPGSNPVAPGWAPIAGGASAWCGIRSHGDLTAVDPITGNPINDNLVQYQGNNSGRQTTSARPEGTDHNFPGYGSQWEQLLYRDVVLPANLGGGQNLAVSFKWTTNMSNGFSAGHSSQTGYYYFDPVKTVASGTDGNFISAAASAGTGGGPVDSFMVYIGAPVEPVAGPAPLFADFIASDGVGYDIYDVQRRWFSEVVKINTPGTTFKQILSAHGVNGSTGVPMTFSSSFGSTVVNPILDADGGIGDGGNVRIVFRVKTNRGSDDENTGNLAFSSGGAGAAIVDEVSISGPSGPLLNDGFEGTNGGVDNNPATAATAAWKSTGKPPAHWFHIHNLSAGLVYTDPCGAIDAVNRQCNMGGNVLSVGNHDLGEKPGGIFGSNLQDQQKYAVSPTINLANDGTDGHYNGMGIDHEIAHRSLNIWADAYVNVFQFCTTGGFWRIGWQSYPSTQPNGVKCWGEMRKSIFNNTTDVIGCYAFFQWDEARSQDFITTTNPSGDPDSVRVYIEQMMRCYTCPISASACSPTIGTNAGGYFDNISVGFFRAPTPPALGILFGTGYNDCFPVNSQNKPVNVFGVAYDTLAAHLRTAFNISPNRKNDVTGPDARENIPGDSTIVFSNGDNVRVDLVFRILPGVGNYVQIGNRASGVARRPDAVPRVAAAATDVGLANPVERFWGAYMANNGEFGTPGGHGASWNPNVWNSARCDTVEVNMFPIRHLFGDEDTNALQKGQYASMYHESDPKYTILGIAKPRCFLNKNKIPVRLNQDQINCGVNYQGFFPTYPPTHYAVGGVPVAGTGLTASENGLPIGNTDEFTKIFPDGQFTPGTLIQYFMRKSSTLGGTAFDMAPDTNFIIPNTDSQFGSFDGHRWNTTAVLPDRWKDPAFSAGGVGMACMLVVDAEDRRGDEFVWNAVADSMGLTTAPKRGAHSGWRARPDQNQDILGNVGGDDSIARRDNGGQAGTVFDLYQVIAGESNIQAGRAGSRGAAKNNTANSVTIDHWSTHGPNEDMARNYRTIVLLMSDVGKQVLGPIANQTDDDIGLFQSFLVHAGDNTLRSMLIQGYEAGNGLNEDHPTFLTNFLRASLRNSDYRLNLSGNPKDVADLIAVPPTGPATYTYAFGNQCFINNDVFNVESAAPAGQASAFYENVGGGGPYVAGVFANDVGGGGGTRPFETLINGFTLGLFGGGFGIICPGCGVGGSDLTLNVGARKYVFDLFTNAFGDLNCQPSGTPVGVGDNPSSGGGSAFVNFMNLKSSNPMRSGETRLAFGLAKTERVEVKVYDVTGRAVKTVANRVFAGGQEHVVTWDGTDEAGNRVRSGVYFYQLRTPTWASQKKLAVLAN